jgi:hypothetical protein
MPRRASDKLVLAAFALLAVSSLALKAAAGPPRDGLMDISTNRFERAVSGILLRQQFALAERTFSHRSTLIVGSRGACQLGVRDARDGAAVATAFATDAGGIGPVRYLYRGHNYDQPPSFAMRLGRIQTEVMSRLGKAPRAPMPVALAVSPACGTSDFGLADVRI